ncbi:penicillin-binding transpeptidase domain-containing protein [Peptococcus simiae]|uniref:penicillin-binding transpeptidase domain-containing protein n=1 Tax=Peptococcus simiae TaxID=1643805 RepID=UPI00397F0978
MKQVLKKVTPSILPALVTGLVLAGLTLGLTACGDDPADAAIDGLIATLQKGDPAAIHATMTPKSQAKYPVETMAERQSHVHQALAVDKVLYKNFKEDRRASTDDRKVYTGKLVLEGDYGSLERDLALTFLPTGSEEAPWQLEWKPEVLFPGLKDGNDLVVKSKPAHRGTIYDRNGVVLAEDAEVSRSYPYGAITAPALGFVRAVTESEQAAGHFKQYPLGTEVGRAGLEKAYNDILSGRNGIQVTLSDDPKTILVKTEPEAGQDITTTLDIRAQEAAYKQINGEFGAVVAANPQNGDMLALVASPSYDPHTWLDTNMTDDDYQNAVSEGLAPMKGIYAMAFTPGSTQKLFTAVIGLHDGVLTHDNGYEIYGEAWQPPVGWGSYKVKRVTPINGFINLHQALISSDNIFFARTGLDLGPQRLVEGLEHMGYAQKVPGKLAVETSQVTEQGYIDQDHETAVADTSYGQYQLQMTPYQMTMTYGLLANGGKIMAPRLLLNEESRVWIDNLASAEDLAYLNKALRQAVAITHPVADRSYAAMTGKTGTAEVGPKGSINLGWFSGYDQNNPDLMMTVMINNVQNRGGSDVNCAYFGRIMDTLYANGSYSPDIPKISDKKEQQ